MRSKCNRIIGGQKWNHRPLKEKHKHVQLQSKNLTAIEWPSITIEWTIIAINLNQYGLMAISLPSMAISAIESDNFDMEVHSKLKHRFTCWHRISYLPNLWLAYWNLVDICLNYVSTISQEAIAERVEITLKTAWIHAFMNESMNYVSKHNQSIN